MITSSQYFLLAAIIVIAVAVSVVAEKAPLGKILSSTVIVMCLGFLLANFNVIPSSAPVYNQVYSNVVPIALPLFLYEARWKVAAKETGRLIYLFFMGATGVIAGALLAAQLVDIGPHVNEWASVFSASYIGGTMNFVAVSSALDLPGDEIAVALAADTIVGLLFLLILMALPAVALLARFYPIETDEAAHGVVSQNREAPAPDRLSFSQIGFACAGLALSFGIYFLAVTTSGLLGVRQYEILFVTIFALLLANFVPNAAEKMKASYHVGVFAMLAFFFVIGASAKLSILLQYGTSFTLFIALIVFSHLLVILSAAKVFKYRLSELVVTSCACALGPTVAAGVAAGKKWKSLVTPGVLLGVFGYAVANFVGLGVALLLQG